MVVVDQKLKKRSKNMSREQCDGDNSTMMAQWLGCRTRNHGVVSSSPVSAVSRSASAGSGRLVSNRSVRPAGISF